MYSQNDAIFEKGKMKKKKMESMNGVKLKCDETFHSRAHSTDTISLESFWVFLCYLHLVKFGLTHGTLVNCPVISRSNFTFHMVVIKVICKCGR